MTVRDEDTERRRDRLFARTMTLLTRAPDITSASRAGYTVSEDLPRLVIELPHSGARDPHADFCVDRAQGVIVHRLPYGVGLEVMPLTAEREALLEELRCEYGTAEQWAADLGIAEEAAHLLIGAGWTAYDYDGWNAVMRVTSAADAREVLARTAQQWQDAGWGRPRPGYGQEYIPGGTPTAGEAAVLADAGITRARVKSLRESGGYRTLAELLNARPPEIPLDATRVIVTGERWLGTVQSTAPEPAVAWLARQPQLWRQSAVNATAGPRPVLIGPYASWVLWDDGQLICGNLLVGLNKWGGQQKAGDDDFPDVPRASEAAALALDLLARTITDPAALAEAAGPFLTAAAHEETEEAKHDIGEYTRSGTTIRRIRHTFHAGGGAELGRLWEISIVDWQAGVDASETRRIARTPAEADSLFDDAVHLATPPPPRRAKEADRQCPGTDVRHCDNCGATSPQPNDFTGGQLGFMAASLGTACGITCYDAIADQPGAHATRFHH